MRREADGLVTILLDSASRAHIAFRRYVLRTQVRSYTKRMRINLVLIGRDVLATDTFPTWMRAVIAATGSARACFPAVLRSDGQIDILRVDFLAEIYNRYLSKTDANRLLENIVSATISEPCGWATIRSSRINEIVESMTVIQYESQENDLIRYFAPERISKLILSRAANVERQSASKDSRIDSFVRLARMNPSRYLVIGNLSQYLEGFLHAILLLNNDGSRIDFTSRADLDKFKRNFPQFSESMDCVDIKTIHDSSEAVWDGILIGHYNTDPQLMHISLRSRFLCSETRYVSGRAAVRADICVSHDRYVVRLVDNNADKDGVLFYSDFAECPDYMQYRFNSMKLLNALPGSSSISHDIVDSIYSIRDINSRTEMISWAYENRSAFSEKSFYQHLNDVYAATSLMDSLITYDVYSQLKFINTIKSIFLSDDDNVIHGAYRALLKRPFERSEGKSIRGISERINLINSIVNSHEFATKHSATYRQIAIASLRRLKDYEQIKRTDSQQKVDDRERYAEKIEYNLVGYYLYQSIYGC